MLFGDKKVYRSPYSDKSWSTWEVAETVWNDLQEATPLDKSETIWAINRGYFPGIPDPDWNNTGETIEEKQKYWKKYDRQVENAAKKCYSDHNAIFDGRIVYEFEYCDNDSAYFAALEHGGLFDNLPHLRISHH